MPGAPPARRPVPFGLGDPKVISWGGGRSNPRAPRMAAGGAARTSGRGCGACPGQPRDAAARGPPRPCTARAQTEPRGREPGLCELLSRRGPIFREFRRRRRRRPSLGPAPCPSPSLTPSPAGSSGNDVPPRAWRLPGDGVKQSSPREERGESGGRGGRSSGGSVSPFQNGGVNLKNCPSAIEACDQDRFGAISQLTNSKLWGQIVNFLPLKYSMLQAQFSTLKRCSPFLHAHDIQAHVFMKTIVGHLLCSRYR